MPLLTDSLRTSCGVLGVGSAANRKRISLRGANQQNAFYTLKAQPYPQSLCRHLSKTFVETVMLV
eukprot:11575275-Karenia_brevis.AAC.1